MICAMATRDLTELASKRAALRKQFLRPESERPESTGRGVHHLALICSDPERTIRFYQDLVGFPLVELFENRDYEGSSHFFFDIGNRNMLGFFDFPGHDHPDFQETIGGVQHLALSTTQADFDAAKVKLEAAGIEFIGPERGIDNSVYLRDPNGVNIELYVQELGVFEGEELIGTSRATGSS